MRARLRGPSGSGAISTILLVMLVFVAVIVVAAGARSPEPKDHALSMSEQHALEIQTLETSIAAATSEDDALVRIRALESKKVGLETRMQRQQIESLRSRGEFDQSDELEAIILGANPGLEADGGER